MMRAKLLHNLGARMLLRGFKLSQHICQFLVFVSCRQIFEIYERFQLWKLRARRTVDQKGGLGRGRIEITQTLHRARTQRLTQERSRYVWMSSRNVKQRANCRRHLERAQTGYGLVAHNRVDVMQRFDEE